MKNAKKPDPKDAKAAAAKEDPKKKGAVDKKGKPIEDEQKVEDIPQITKESNLLLRHRSKFGTYFRPSVIFSWFHKLLMRKVDIITIENQMLKKSGVF